MPTTIALTTASLSLFGPLLLATCACLGVLVLSRVVQARKLVSALEVSGALAPLATERPTPPETSPIPRHVDESEKTVLRVIATPPPLPSVESSERSESSAADSAARTLRSERIYLEVVDYIELSAPLGAA